MNNYGVGIDFTVAKVRGGKTLNYFPAAVKKRLFSAAENNSLWFTLRAWTFYYLELFRSFEYLKCSCWILYVRAAHLVSPFCIIKKPHIYTCLCPSSLLNKSVSSGWNEKYLSVAEKFRSCFNDITMVVIIQTIAKPIRARIVTRWK